GSVVFIDGRVGGGEARLIVDEFHRQGEGLGRRGVLPAVVGAAVVLHLHVEARGAGDVGVEGVGQVAAVVHGRQGAEQAGVGDVADDVLLDGLARLVGVGCAAGFGVGVEAGDPAGDGLR